MFVSQSIALKTFKFLTLFVARAATTGGRGQDGWCPPNTKFRPPQPKATVVEDTGKYCKRPPPPPPLKNFVPPRTTL